MVELMFGRTYNDSFMIYVILHVKQTNINKQTKETKKESKKETNKQTNRRDVSLPKKSAVV